MKSFPRRPQQTTQTPSIGDAVEVEQAKQGRGQQAIVRTIASGCAPVRVVETVDGRYIWVATRGGDPDRLGVVGRVLAFDVQTLLSDSPNNALVGFGGQRWQNL